LNRSTSLFPQRIQEVLEEEFALIPHKFYPKQKHITRYEHKYPYDHKNKILGKRPCSCLIKNKKQKLHVMAKHDRSQETKQKKIQEKHLVLYSRLIE
jgi:hypothetical protein